eukprot:5928454-Amphidinium_carterae.1
MPTWRTDPIQLHNLIAGVGDFAGIAIAPKSDNTNGANKLFGSCLSVPAIWSSVDNSYSVACVVLKEDVMYVIIITTTVIVGGIVRHSYHLENTGSNVALTSESTNKRALTYTRLRTADKELDNMETAQKHILT